MRNTTLRFILFHTNTTDEVCMDLLALREMRDLDVVAFYELGLPAYREQGTRVSPQDMRENMTAELIMPNTCVILHPETEPACALQLMHVLAWLEVPLLKLDEIPDVLPIGQEAIDLFCAENMVDPSRGMKRTTMNKRVRKAVPIVPEHIPVLEITNAGEVLEQPRTLWEQLRGLVERYRRWEVRFSDRHLRGLKNPVSRELMEQRTTRRPIPYKLKTAPPLTTG